MPRIKATDIAYARLRVPDLDRMKEFLTRFGLVRADGALHGRQLHG